MSLDELVAAFAEHTAAQTDAVWRGNARKGNKHADRCLEAFHELIKHGDAGREALTVLFKHPRSDVRVRAAAFLLRYKTQEAKAVLEGAAKGEGWISFVAQQALQRWQEDSWSLDPG